VPDYQKPTELHPERARAVITTDWAGGYKPVVVKKIESFMIDTNMDQDADSFEMVVGDPTNQLAALKNRDGEIRIQIFGIGLQTDYLLTGLVDEVEVTDTGSVTLSGRDRSSIACDTQAVAGKWQERRANEFIEERAKKFNIATRYNLAVGPVKKTIRQDGSETEWEFWYRLIRREQMYLWFTPDGALVSSKLGANAPPSYFFGTPPDNISASDKKKWVPVENVSYRKTTQTRIGNVQVFYTGNDNKKHATSFIADNTILDWEKRPLKYIEDTHVSTSDGAKRTAYEEIFESKVGALEIQITIPDLGFVVRQNRIARLRIPEIDLGDDWFIIGTQILAGPDGFVQHVRLREKNYAITRRIPEEPKVEPEPGDKGAEETAKCLELADIACRSEWTGFLEKAANRWHSNVPYDLYLAILMAIMEQEGCRNVRQEGSIEWFKWTGEPKHGITTAAEYRDTFANNHGEHGGGVGPFQLTTQSFKVHADLLFGGKESELDGNRWMPEANIMTGAWVLTGKGGGSLREETVWAAVKAYNGSGEKAEAYMRSIKNMVYGNGGYLEAIQKAISVCKDTGDIGGDDDDPANGIVIPTRHITDHCTDNYAGFYAYDFMNDALTKVYIEEPAKADPAYGQSPHLQNWHEGKGGWTFQIVGDSGTQYWFTHLDENDPKKYTGGKLGANGYVGRLTDSAYKAKLIGGAHVHVGSPQWPVPPRGSRGC
jgi:prophage tail gpP-like protein